MYACLDCAHKLKIIDPTLQMKIHQISERQKLKNTENSGPVYKEYAFIDNKRLDYECPYCITKKANVNPIDGSRYHESRSFGGVQFSHQRFVVKVEIIDETSL